MRIVFLSVLFRHPTKGAKTGGGEISNRLLLEALAEKHEVFIVSATGTGLWGERINNVTYFDLSTSGLIARLPQKLHRLAAKILFRHLTPNLLKQIRPEIILCATLEFNAAVAYGRTYNVPVGSFIRAFENFGEYNTHSLSSLLKRGLRTLLYGNTQNKAVNRLDFLLPNSDFMDTKCKDAFNVPTTQVIYPPIDLIRTKDLQAIQSDGSCIKKVAMVSGAKKKGGELFIQLCQYFPGIQFSIIGYRGDLSNAPPHPNLQLHAWVKEPHKLIAEADIILVPSIWEEPFGRIAVEALQCGTPVLVSNIGGLPETVDYQDFLMVEAGNLSAWREKLNTCLDLPPEFINANANAMRGALKYSMQQQIAALESAMHNAIQVKLDTFEHYRRTS